MITINDVKLIKLNTFLDSEGSLVPIEFDSTAPFEVKRVFYVYGVHNQNDRGEHSHHKTKQFLIKPTLEDVEQIKKPLDIEKK